MKATKFLLFAVCAAILSSCAPKFSSRVFYTDYQKYAAEGFFVTESNTVPFDYTPVGSVLIRQKAGVMSENEIMAQEVREKRGYDEIYGEYEKKRFSNSWKSPSDYTLLDAAQKVAMGQNADGIINLRVYFPDINNRNVVELAGMLIKRK